MVLEDDADDLGDWDLTMNSEATRKERIAVLQAEIDVIHHANEQYWRQANSSDGEKADYYRRLDWLEEIRSELAELRKREFSSHTPDYFFDLNSAPTGISALLASEPSRELERAENKRERRKKEAGSLLRPRAVAVVGYFLQSSPPPTPCAGPISCSKKACTT